MPIAITGRSVWLPVFALALLAIAPTTGAQVYKCKDAHGGTTYADAPCAVQGKSLKLPQSPNGSFANATVCAQLQDEMRRLDGEADRDARRGRPKSAAGAKRKQALLAQYHRSCAAISRSAAPR
jgi:hypothetical protein